MEGGGEDWVEMPWEFLLWYLLMGIAMWGSKLGSLAGESVCTDAWG